MARLYQILENRGCDPWLEDEEDYEDVEDL